MHAVGVEVRGKREMREGVQAKAATFAVNILRDECEFHNNLLTHAHTHTQIRIHTCTLCWLLAMWAWHLLFAFTVVFIILLNKDKAINYFCLRSARPFRQMSVGECECVCVCVGGRALRRRAVYVRVCFE